MERDFDNRIAVVTGGGSGIGRAVARRLAAAGADLVVANRSDGGEAVYLEKLVDPGLPYQFVSRAGGRIPLHCTAIGKALLAAMPREQVRELIARPLERRTANTLTSSAELEAEAAPCATTAARPPTRSASPRSPSTCRWRPRRPLSKAFGA